jgi:uncharacterized membrane protein
MLVLLAAAATFVLMHLLISGTRLRDAAVQVIGEGPYLGLYSLASIAALTWLGFAFGAARDETANLTLWSATNLTKDVQAGLQLLATMLVVAGLTTPNPTSVRQQAALENADSVRGVLRVTRHPFLWGVALWAVGHILVNGNLAAFVLFGSLLILALFGTTSIDAKRRRALGAQWAAFAAKTSNVPFAAILTRRQSLRLGEIGWLRFAGAAVVYGVLLAGHGYVFGVSALP